MPRAHAWLADVRERQHRLADAIEQYRIAIAQQPDFRMARLELAKDLLYAGRSKEAIPVLLPALQVEDQNTPVAMMFLVQAYVNMGDRATARKYLEQAHQYRAAQRAIESAAADRKQFKEPGVRLKKGNRTRRVRPVAVAKRPSRWWPHVWKIALLWALVFAAYSNSFDAGFVYDNESAILQDARVHEATLHNVHRILTESYWVDQPTTDLYRPLTTLSYLLNYAILGNGTNPAGYHWVNLVLHAANVSLVYALGILIFGEPALALALAAIWGLHPLLTEGVTNIVGRADLLAALGHLAGPDLPHPGDFRDRMAQGQLADALASAQTMALFSKENGVVLPALMLAYDLIWVGPSSAGGGESCPMRFLALPFIAFFVLRSQLHMHLEVPFHKNPLVGAAFWPARMTAFKVIGRFLWLFIWPARLSADYSYNSVPLFQWSLGGLGGSAGADGACAVRRRDRARIRVCAAENKPVCFFIFFFFIALAPTSNLFILIGSAMSERFMYLPAIGLTGCAVALIYALAQRYSRPGLGKILWAAAAMVCLALGARTYARNFDWHDEATLWASVTAVNPDDALAHLNLGSALLEIPGRVPDALSEYQRAVQIYPDYAEAHNNLGAILLQFGPQYGSGRRIPGSGASRSGLPRCTQ